MKEVPSGRSEVPSVHIPSDRIYIPSDGPEVPRDTLRVPSDRSAEICNFVDCGKEYIDSKEGIEVKIEEEIQEVEDVQDPLYIEDLTQVIEDLQESASAFVEDLNVC